MPHLTTEPTGRDPRLLANAAREADARGLHAFPIVDADCHHFEMESFAKFARYIEHPTILRRAMESVRRRSGQFNLLPASIGDQFVAARLKRPGPSAEELHAEVPHDVGRLRESMDQMAIDLSVVFPTTMLNLGLHPQIDVEVALARAYDRWLVEEVLAAEPRIKSMLYLPFNHPDESLRLIRELGDKPGVVGFMVTSVRYAPVHDDRYLPIYAELEERGLPLGFHPTYNWHERSMEMFNRFISVHALGFPLFNMVHLINVVVNGLPERFPRLKWIWMECGVGWLPFLMLRLDNEYLMRPSEAPQLTKKPSEYMRGFYYTSQPLEVADNPAHMAGIFEMIAAETQLLYASDYPHWDFDLPGRVYDLPFLSETARRRILGGNALEVFGIAPPPGPRYA